MENEWERERTSAVNEWTVGMCACVRVCAHNHIHIHVAVRVHIWLRRQWVLARVWATYVEGGGKGRGKSVVGGVAAGGRGCVCGKGRDCVGVGCFASTLEFAAVVEQVFKLQFGHARLERAVVCNRPKRKGRRIPPVVVLHPVSLLCQRHRSSIRHLPRNPKRVSRSRSKASNAQCSHTGPGPTSKPAKTKTNSKFINCHHISFCLRLHPPHNLLSLLSPSFSSPCPGLPESTCLPLAVSRTRR